jgi:hypothetical protein
VTRAFQEYASPEGPTGPSARAFRAAHSWPDDGLHVFDAGSPIIHFVGVWDTVGALGVPSIAGVKLDAERFAFHDTRVSRYVRYVYQAAAVDEQRPDFKLCPFTKEDPAFPAFDRLAEAEAMPTGETQTLLQAWFPGAHADVGGGYTPAAITARGLASLAKHPSLWRRVLRAVASAVLRVAADSDDADADQFEIDGTGPLADERSPRDMANLPLFWMQSLAGLAGLTLAGTEAAGGPRDDAAPFGTKRAVRPKQPSGMALPGAEARLFARRLREIDVSADRCLWHQPHDPAKAPIWAGRGRAVRPVAEVSGAVVIAPAVAAKYLRAAPAPVPDPAPTFCYKAPGASASRAPGQYAPTNVYCKRPMQLEQLLAFRGSQLLAASGADGGGVGGCSTVVGKTPPGRTPDGVGVPPVAHDSRLGLVGVSGQATAEH